MLVVPSVTINLKIMLSSALVRRLLRHMSMLDEAIQLINPNSATPVVTRGIKILALIALLMELIAILILFWNELFETLQALDWITFL